MAAVGVGPGVDELLERRIEETAAVDGVRFFMASGNIDAGIFKLYGIT